MCKKLIKFVISLIFLCLFFPGCDSKSFENFGVKHFYSVYIVVECPDDADLSLCYQIPDIGMEESEQSVEVMEYKEKELAEYLALDEEKKYRFFHLERATLGSIQDRFNFEFDLNLTDANTSTSYNKTLIIPKLESGNNTVPFTFEDGDKKIPGWLLYRYGQEI